MTENISSVNLIQSLGVIVIINLFLIMGTLLGIRFWHLHSTGSDVEEANRAKYKNQPRCPLVTQILAPSV
jgi:hypothetical protein